MRVDVIHLRNDQVGRQLPPCGMVAFTLAHPFQRDEIVREADICWPELSGNNPRADCGSCGGYAGESLDQDFCRPHVCVPERMPGGYTRCRAGCEL